MTGIVDFLTARLDEDEQVAREANGNRSGSDLFVFDDDYKHDHILITPGRVFADVAAKRAILSMHAGGHSCAYSSAMSVLIGTTAPCKTLRALATAHADNPDFDPSWRIETGETP